MDFWKSKLPACCGARPRSDDSVDFRYGRAKSTVLSGPQFDRNVDEISGILSDYISSLLIKRELKGEFRLQIRSLPPGGRDSGLHVDCHEDSVFRCLCFGTSAAFDELNPKGKTRFVKSIRAKSESSDAVIFHESPDFSWIQPKEGPPIDGDNCFYKTRFLQCYVNYEDKLSIECDVPKGRACLTQ